MDDERNYNPVTPEIKNDMRPGFLGGGSDGANERKTRNTDAAKNLASAEQAAAGDLNSNKGGLYNASKNENEAGGLYKGEGVNDRVGRTVSAAKDMKKGNFKGAFKKAGPGVAVLLLVFVVGGIMSATQLFQPFALIAQFQESFNSMHTSAYNRSARILRYQMDTGSRKSPLKTTVFGTQKFSLSQKQIEAYEKQGLKYNENYEGTGKRVLEYETEGGQKRVVAASKDDADFLKKAGHTNAISFDAVLNDTTFAHKFTTASQGWRGQFANWYGTKTGDFLSKNGLTRNMFKDWEKTKAEVEADPNRTTLDAVKDTIKNRIKESAGISITRAGSDKDDGNGGSRYSRGQTEKFKATNAKLDSLKGKFTTGANVPCAVMDFIGAVSLMAAGAEALQIINITTAYMEAVDKTKAGYGDEAPINELSNSLNEQTHTANVKIVLDASGTGVTDPDTGESTTIFATTVKDDGQLKSAMQSAGVAALFGNGLTDPNDASVQSFNLTSSINTILGGLGMATTSFMACTVVKAVAAMASLGMTIVQCFLPPLVGCFGGELRTALGKLGISVGVAVGIMGVIKIVTPWLESVMERDLISTLAGEDLGNALVSGANMYQGNVHKANGGSLSTKIVYEEFAVAQQQMIAEEAKIERETLSPFDMTSKNTFMGSLMTQLMAFSTSSSLMNTLTSAGSVMSSSLMAMTPKTSAIASQIAESLPTEDEYAQTCPYLASIGAVGDSFCNPYIVTDMDTMDMDPGDVILAVGSENLEGIDSSSSAKNETNSMDLAESTGANSGDVILAVEIADLGGASSNDNVKIKKDSDLAKYIEYCSERTSAFGVVDQNYVSKISTGNEVADAVIGATSVGDVLDLIDSKNNFANIGYINGGACVASDGPSEIDSALGTVVDVAKEYPDWDTAKYYQRFIEDQSLAESMGIIEKSAVTAYLEEYYEENPLDESYEGQLARWSGLSKETVSDVLDVIAYYNYVGNYDPSERYAFGGSGVVDDLGILDDGVMFDEEMTMDGMSAALEGVVYFDVRNRNFVA